MVNLLMWKSLGGGRWRMMHYMIMDTKLKYNYELNNFLHIHYHIWFAPNIHVQIETIFGVKCNINEATK